MTYTFSASQINTFMQDPCIWVIQSLFKMRSPPNAWAEKGTIFGDFVERAALTGDWGDVMPIKLAIAKRCDELELEVPSLTSMDTDWQNAKEHFQRWEKEFGRPVATQEEFIIDCKHGKLRGYIDVRYQTCCADIKNRTKIEKDFKTSDMIQMACYWKAKGCPQWLLEFSAGKKRVSLFGNELEFWWKIAEHNMGRMEIIALDYEDCVHQFGDKRQACLHILSGLPIHNPRLYWWPAAEELILEAIS